MHLPVLAEPVRPAGLPGRAAEIAVAEAAAALARSKLRQLEAGTGREEIQQALSEAESVEALLAYEAKSLGRMRRLSRPPPSAPTITTATPARRAAQAPARRAPQASRGPEAGGAAQEIEVARSELALAEERVCRVRVERDLLLIRAPMTGKILEVYRHQGDSVSLDRPSPIVRMADTSRLRIRLEIDEASVARLRPGQGGTFQIRGVASDAGRLFLTTILPAFGPKRLFNPDIAPGSTPGSSRCSVSPPTTACRSTWASADRHTGRRCGDRCRPTPRRSWRWKL